MYGLCYRKWRPQTFADTIRQQHVTGVFTAAILIGRLSHAYLFTEHAQHRQDHLCEEESSRAEISTASIR